MLSIKIDTSAASRQLAGFAKQIPFAKAAAVNDIAFQAMRAENAAIGKIFSHPRPFTQRATQVEQKATKAAPSAIVSLRAVQAEYLAPYEFGGMHSLPGRYILEPVDIKTDAYKQLPKGTVARLRADPTVFVGTVHGILGFWKRGARDVREMRGRGKQARDAKAALVGGTLTLLIRMLPNRDVNKHLDFEQRALDLAQRAAPQAVAAAIDKAIATAFR